MYRIARSGVRVSEELITNREKARGLMNNIFINSKYGSLPYECIGSSLSSYWELETRDWTPPVSRNVRKTYIYIK